MVQHDDTVCSGGAGEAGYSAPKPPERIGIPGIVALLLIGLLAFRFALPHTRFLKLTAALAVAVPIHLLGIVIVGRAVGMRFERVSIYFGGALWRQRIGNSWWSIGWLPVGGSVKFPGTDDRPYSAVDRKDLWQTFHPLLRAIVSLSGCIALIVCASILIGSKNALSEITELPRQCVVLIADDPGPMLKDFFEFIDVASFPILLGVVTAKFAAINLLPSPICNGGQALLLFAEWLLRRRVPEKLVNELGIFTLIPMFLILIRAASFIPRAWTSAGH